MKNIVLFLFLSVSCFAQDAEPSVFSKQAFALRDAAAWRAKLGAASANGIITNGLLLSNASGATITLSNGAIAASTYSGRVVLPAGTTNSGSAPLKWAAQGVFMGTAEPGADTWNTNSANPLASRFFTDVFSNRNYYVISPSNGLTILTNGFVGIGTNNPTVALVVVGPRAITTYGTNLFGGWASFGKTSTPTEAVDVNGNVQANQAIVGTVRASSGSVLNVGSVSSTLVQLLAASITISGPAVATNGVGSLRTNAWTISDLPAGGFSQWNSNATGIIYMSVNVGGTITNKVLLQ